MISRPSIIERIRALDSSKRDFPGYRTLLDLHGEILEILQSLEDPPYRITREKLSEDKLKTLKEEALHSKMPIMHFLNSSMFDGEAVLNAVRKIVGCAMRWRPEAEAIRRLKEALDRNEIDSDVTIKATVKGDAIWFQNLGESFGIEPSLLLFVFSMPFQPFFEELAGRVGEEFMENWMEPACPVCGRYSVIARMKDKKRYMICTFCGAEYLIDQFLCTNCGNRDPNTLGFVSFEEYPEYEINFCEKCNHYIKVLRESPKNRLIPPGLEDLMTQELDRFAKKELNLFRE
ncbi:MAG: formate dehydrogenase accessory protein FdhE [Candidatus Bathyarchaeia archaeon]